MNVATGEANNRDGDPGFSEGGSESGVDIGSGANPNIVSLKQGVWGAQLPRSYEVFNL